jgi:hypothetical protein
MSEQSSGTSSERVFGWDEKLAEGKAGEEVVARWLASQVYPERVEDMRHVRRMQDVDTDFFVGATGYEVKTDLRADATGNLFLELDALEKSRADIWLFYLPQRDWLFRFAHDDLLAYALAKADTLGKVVTTEHNGRRWSVRGVPVPMSELLLKLRGQLHTRLSSEVNIDGED